jgi:hypothetical protein
MICANASGHKAMSYGRMDAKITELENQVQPMLSQAESCDQNEDALYGKGKRGDQLPKQLRFRQSRLEKIRETKKVIEQEAQANFRLQQKAYKKKLKAKEQRDDRRGRPPKAPWLNRILTDNIISPTPTRGSWWMALPKAFNKAITVKRLLMKRIRLLLPPALAKIPTISCT